MKQIALHKIFEKYGEIISLKICFNGDHSSKGFGYVTFEEEKAALAAVEAGAHLEADKVVAVPYKWDSAASSAAVISDSVSMSPEEAELM